MTLRQCFAKAELITCQ